MILHDYEAILAGLAIFLSHFYWVHLNPDVYPMSLVWLNGELTEEEMKLHHPKEFEQIMQREQGQGSCCPMNSKHAGWKTARASDSSSTVRA